MSEKFGHPLFYAGMRAALRKSIEGGVEKFFDGGFAQGWFFKLSDAFMESLDIALTLKGATRGTCFSFAAGDVFYDDASAYFLEWGRAKLKIKFCARVLQANPSSIVQQEISGGKKTREVVDGLLVFALDSYSGGEVFTREIETNQYDFANFLRTGILESAGLRLS